MTNKFHDSPAFPRPAVIHPTSGRPIIGSVEGMSVRDHFAGLALQGILASDDNRACSSTTPADIKAEQEAFVLGTARAAFAYADAMIKARDE